MLIPHEFSDMIKDLEISKALLFPAKMVVAFPLVYHYLNGIRHLVRKHKYELCNMINNAILCYRINA